VGKKCPFVHRKLISSGSTPAIVNQLLFGMSVFGYRRNTSISMADGSRKANCKSRQKESSIFTASPFKLYARNMSSLDNPLKKLSNKDFAMLVIPTGKRSTSTQNGRKTVSRFMKMGK
jgi:hypothetical protein